MMMNIYKRVRRSLIFSQSVCLLVMIFIFICSLICVGNRYKEIDSGLFLDIWVDNPCYFNGHTGE